MWGWIDGSDVSYTNWKSAPTSSRQFSDSQDPFEFNDYDYLFEKNNGPTKRGGECTQV